MGQVNQFQKDPFLLPKLDQGPQTLQLPKYPPVFYQSTWPMFHQRRKHRSAALPMPAATTGRLQKLRNPAIFTLLQAAGSRWHVLVHGLHGAAKRSVALAHHSEVTESCLARVLLRTCAAPHTRMLVLPGESHTCAP